jgi:hypothetical protein
VQLRLDSHEPAVSVDDLRHGVKPPALTLMVFRDDRNGDAQHNPFAAAAIFRIAGACHPLGKRSDLRFQPILP